MLYIHTVYILFKVTVITRQGNGKSTRHTGYNDFGCVVIYLRGTFQLLKSSYSENRDENCVRI